MPARRPLVLIDLDESDIATIRDRLIALQEREHLDCVDIASLCCNATAHEVRTFRSAKARASQETLRELIAAMPELAAGMPVDIRPR